MGRPTVSHNVFSATAEHSKSKRDCYTISPLLPEKFAKIFSFLMIHPSFFPKLLVSPSLHIRISRSTPGGKWWFFISLRFVPMVSHTHVVTVVQTNCPYGQISTPHPLTSTLDGAFLWRHSTSIPLPNPPNPACSSSHARTC